MRGLVRNMMASIPANAPSMNHSQGVMRASFLLESVTEADAEVIGVAQGV